MTTTPSAPPLDAECGAAWRVLSDGLFDGGGPVFTPASLPVLRSADMVDREAMLAEHGMTHRDVTVPGPAGELTVALFTPATATTPAPALFWVHGGGMVVGNRFGALGAMGPAAAAGAVVASVEYRLAPEHPAPAPQDDCVAALAWFADHAAELGVDPDRIVLGGESAGGGLAAATALRVRDHGGPALAGLYLLCPMLDDRMTSVSAGQVGDDLLWTRASNEFGWRALLGERFGTADVSPHEAPGRATDLAGLPPTFVDVGAVDLFRDEDVAFASGIWAAGGDAELHVWAGGFHGFEMMAPAAALTHDVVDARSRWLRRVLR